MRLFSLVTLAIAVIAAVIDAARSLGASRLVTTSLGESWMQLSPDTLSKSGAWAEANLYPLLWDPVLLAILKAPTWLFFLALAGLFYLASYRRNRIPGRFAAH
ncbi:MAG: hypothetical protein ACRECW_03145 [Phyllobacterium sp.]